MGDTPLHVAANHGHLEIVNLLLKFGSNASLRNNDKLLAEELASDTTIRNTIQISKLDNNRDYGYAVDDYNDDSD